MMVIRLMCHGQQNHRQNICMLCISRRIIASVRPRRIPSCFAVEWAPWSVHSAQLMVLGCVRCFSYACVKLCKLCRFCMIIWTHLKRIYMKLMDLPDQLEIAQKLDSLADTSRRHFIFVEIDNQKLVCSSFHPSSWPTSGKLFMERYPSATLL